MFVAQLTKSSRPLVQPDEDCLSMYRNCASFRYMYHIIYITNQQLNCMKRDLMPFMLGFHPGHTAPTQVTIKSNHQRLLTRNTELTSKICIT